MHRFPARKAVLQALRLRPLLLSVMLLGGTAGTAAAAACSIDVQALDARLEQIQQSYLILSDIGCADEDPTLPAHVLLCESMWDGGPLWKMAQLDDAAWVYAYENATGTEADHDNPMRDETFIARRDACTDEACLCTAYIEHTNDSLGGTSPYAQ